MKLAISNIAWAPAHDEEAYDLLARSGVRGIEMAPTRWWPDLSLVPMKDVVEMRQRVEARGFEAVAFQSLFFGKPDFRLLGDTAERQACATYLKAVLGVAMEMGAGTLVLGSPKNRLRGDLSMHEAYGRARDILQSLGPACERASCTISLEPNPSDYGADFLTTTKETADFVRNQQAPWIRMNLDVGAISMNREDPEETVTACIDVVGHVHISEPGLFGFEQPKADHEAVAEALHARGYSGWICIEMRQPPDGLQAVARAIKFVRETYLV